jgi:phytoene dehydrogenase-like protein
MNYDVIVVGGGAAGLAASAYASRAGLSVGIFEQQPRLGGLVQSVTRDGFTFDMGLRAIENAGIVLPMLEELGLSLDYVRSPVSVGIGSSIIRLESRESLTDYRDFLLSQYPRSGADIDRIIAVIRRVMNDMDVLYGIDNPLFKDLAHDRRYVLRTLLPWLLRFPFTIGRINRMAGPVETLLRELTDDASLRSSIGQHFFRGTPAFFAMSYFSLYLDYLYPRGGTGALTELLAGYIRRSGVDIHCATPIVALDPESGTITDHTGRSWSYGTLIWCADLKRLYRSVDPTTISDRRLKSAIAARRDELEPCAGSDSVLSLYLAVDESPSFFGEISEGHLFYTPDARGLHDLHTTKLDSFLHERADNLLPRDLVEAYLKEYFARTTYEISIPALKDPAMAPAGQTGVIISALFDYRLTRRVHEDGWYDELREFCADAMLSVLSDHLYPDLSKKVISRFVTTPVSIEDQTGNTDGAITGWSFTSATMPAVHTMQHVSRSVVTPIPRVLQAGQWTYSPAGLPMAFLTGKLAANRARKIRGR